MAITQAPEQLRIPLSKIDVAKVNPRVDVGDVADLAKSIAELGVLEPIVVVERGGRYEAVTGSRRLAASKLAGKTDIPVRVMDLSDAEAAAAALIENLHRKDLNPIEEAEAYREYLALSGKPQKDLAKTIGVVPSTIANALRLLDLAQPAKEAIVAGILGAAHGLVMLKLVDPGLTEVVLKTAKQYDARAEGKPKVGTTIPLRIIEDVVDRANRDHIAHQRIAALPEALAKRKEELEAKNVTVTWRPLPQYGNQESEVATYLGKPPKPIAFGEPSYERMEDWKSHAKDCGCDSVALSIGDFGANALKVISKVVCTNVKAARARRRIHGNGDVNRPNKAQKEKQAREHATKLMRLTDLDGFKGKRLAVAKKLAKREIGTEVARIVLFSIYEQGFWSGIERLALWDAIAAMPLRKVKQKIVDDAVGKLMPGKYRGMTELIGPHLEPILAKFHITLADADLLPKLDDAKKGKKK